jgi:hypothetical protein
MIEPRIAQKTRGARKHEQRRRRRRPFQIEAGGGAWEASTAGSRRGVARARARGGGGSLQCGVLRSGAGGVLRQVTWRRCHVRPGPTIGPTSYSQRSGAL